MDQDELERQAIGVLDMNWIGGATKPAPRLYPHQWSWDSAFIAIGNARHNWSRASAELGKLFDAQWANGMVPHIVFTPNVVGYSPPAEMWDSGQAPHSPAHVATSGLCQPPVHAMAVRRVAELGDGPERAAFLDAMYQPLDAWHSYLHEFRANGSALVEIWHPWESGMDNSPAWDSALAALEFSADEVPNYGRPDAELSGDAARPTDWDYDRYMYLVGWLRNAGYGATSDPGAMPFRVRDVLFNSLLVRSERDLAWIATQVGADGSVHLDRANALATAIDDELWNEESGGFASFDAVAGAFIEAPVVGALTALLANPSPEHREAVIARMKDDFLYPIGSDDAMIVPTVPVSHEQFEPTRYWRGPVWINIMWLLVLGLESCGDEELARRLQRGAVELVGAGGCAEYFDPTTGIGHGTADFSWTAALVLDLMGPAEAIGSQPADV